MKFLLVLGAEDSRISEDEREWLEMIVEREKADGLMAEITGLIDDHSPFVLSVRALASDRGWQLSEPTISHGPVVVAILPSLGPVYAARYQNFWELRGVPVLKPNWQSEYAR